MNLQIDPPVKNAPEKRPRSSSKLMLGIIAVLLVIIAGAAVWLAISLEASKKELETERLARQQAELDRDQTMINRDFEDLNAEFETLEMQTRELKNDSLRQDITEKYEAAKTRMAELQKEVNALRSENRDNAETIRKLRSEIESLRTILRTYVDQINQLNEENKQLKNENNAIKEENNRLNDRVAETNRENEHLSERMTLAEKLNVTGVSLTPLNKKGKNEKKVEKAKQLMVTFTIPQNNSTPVGEKVIYLRIVSPSGQVLGNAGTFSFEGASVAYTARKTIEYSGDEIAGIHIYWDVNTALSPGAYTIELFTGNYRLASRSFTLN